MGAGPAGDCGDCGLLQKEFFHAGGEGANGGTEDATEAALHGSGSVKVGGGVGLAGAMFPNVGDAREGRRAGWVICSGS